MTSAIWKEPAEGPVVIEGVNLAGDDQADRRVDGGVDKAVYAYAVEDYDWWATDTGALKAGTFGENLTTLGLDLNGCCIGDRWHVGSAILEIAQPRQPCFKLGMRMGDDDFPGKFAAAGRPGVYLRIIAAGVVTSGDAIVVDPADQPAIRISSLVEETITHDVLRVTLPPKILEYLRAGDVPQCARVVVRRSFPSASGNARTIATPISMALGGPMSAPPQQSQARRHVQTRPAPRRRVQRFRGDQPARRAPNRSSGLEGNPNVLSSPGLRLGVETPVRSIPTSHPATGRRLQGGRRTRPAFWR